MFNIESLMVAKDTRARFRALTKTRARARQDSQEAGEDDVFVNVVSDGRRNRLALARTRAKNSVTGC